MSRFIWIDNKELYDSIFGMSKYRSGEEYSSYDDEDEGLVYDTEKNEIVMHFGNDMEYYPSCGMSPNDKYLKIIMDALNEKI